MSALYTMLTGTFTSDGTAFTLDLPSDVQSFELINLTDIGSTAGATPVMRAEWFLGMDDGEAIVADKTNGASTIAIADTVTSGGFTRVTDSGNQTPSASVALTAGADAVNQAATAVAKTGDTSLLTADSSVVRMFNVTDMQQIAGMDFTVGTVNSNTDFELKYLDSSGFADDGTAGSFRVIPFNPRYYPRRRFITAITQAASAVITLSVTHGFTAGQAVRIQVPSAFGMVEIDELIGNITAISTANNTITVDIDSSAFTSFAFPTSATAAAGVTFAQVIPVGETANGTYANELDDATDNQAIRGLTIGTDVQTSGKLYRWVATRGIAL